MPGKARTSKEMDKADYDRIIPGLRTELGELQRAVYDSAIPVMIAFEGLQASGKSEMVNELIRAMDPRGFRVHAIDEPSEEEALKPFMWRFWKRTPPGGRIDIFDQSWYSRLLAEKIKTTGKKNPLSSKKDMKAIAMLANFELQLATEGGREEARPYQIIKIFLDIGKKEQKKRLSEVRKDKISMFLFEKPDWKAHKYYDEHRKVYARMMKLTDAGYAPWNIIDADDRRFATVKVYETVIASLKKRLKEKQQSHPGTDVCKPAIAELNKKETPGRPLDKIDLSLSMPEEEYRKRLKSCQQELTMLQLKAYEKKVPAVIVFEGMDAAGKGGSIKRLSESFDPRGYKVVPIGVPDAWEMAHHYLWRFWLHFPARGYITIFDRSWYGRVLVERVEGLTPVKCWQEAYDEINQMEEALHDNGTAIVKFWLHIDQDVQHERFMARETDPDKKWKINSSDWRNRSKWDAYMIAADEMVRRTGTTWAPWTIVPSNDKLYSRITVMETVIDTIKKAL